MSAPVIALDDQGMTLRQAALVAGLGLLVMVFAAPFAQFFVFPKLIVAGDIATTTQNIVAHKSLFVAGTLAYLATFMCDVIVAWALYVLLAPANRSVSMLTAWFRLVYAIMALVALTKLFTVFRILGGHGALTAEAATRLHPQVEMLLQSYRYEAATSFMFFGMHLGLLGWLVYRSGYIPRILGALVGIAGAGYLVNGLRPYLFPDANLDFLLITFFGELVFMGWLLARGWKIQGPKPRAR